MPGAGRVPPPEWTARRVRASGSSVLLALATLVAVYLARELVSSAGQPLGWLAAAAALALVLSPLVELLARRIPRGLAIVTTLVVVVAAVAGIGVGLVVEVQDQLESLRVELPEAAAEIEQGAGERSFLAEIEFGSLVEDVVDQAEERISPEPTIEGTVGTVPAFLVTGILAVFLLIWGDDLFAGLRRQISDPDRRDRMTRVAAHAAHLAQQYVLAIVLAALTVTVAGWLVFRLVDLPTPLVLGVVLGAAATVPYIGVLAGSVPVLLLSAASQPAGVTVALGVGLVVAQALHTVVVRRGVERRTLRVGPAPALVALMVGSDLYGTGGALVALLAVVLAMAVAEAWRHDQVRHPGAADVPALGPTAG